MCSKNVGCWITTSYSGGRTWGQEFKFSTPININVEHSAKKFSDNFLKYVQMSVLKIILNVNFTKLIAKFTQVLKNVGFFLPKIRST
jgi:hypothetical protein